MHRFIVKLLFYTYTYVFKVYVMLSILLTVSESKKILQTFYYPKPTTPQQCMRERKLTVESLPVNSENIH